MLEQLCGEQIGLILVDSLTSDRGGKVRSVFIALVGPLASRPGPIF